MTTFAIEQRTQQYIFAAPKWADVLAKGYLAVLAFCYWLKLNKPKAEVYLLTRYDLARRYIGPIPPAHWRLGYAFAMMTFFFLWQEMLISSSVKVWGGICLG